MKTLDRFKSWHAGLSKSAKVVLWSVTAVMAGSAISAAASPNSSPTAQTSNLVTSQQQSSDKPTEHQPVITTKTVTETSDIPFTSTTVDDSTLAKGKTEVRVAGVNGVKTSTYEVTYADGVQTDKKLIKEETTTEPIGEVTAIGTYVAETKPACDPNYTGACVPNVYPADVDCAGGSGNGPYYVQGPVYVVGVDRYGLDANHDGVGCQ